jgi:hypothetical protein
MISIPTSRSIWVVAWKILRKVLGIDDRLLLSSCPASPGLDLVVDHQDRIRWMVK